MYFPQHLRYCIVLYYEAIYWWPFRPLSYRHYSGVVRNPHSTLAEWGIFNLQSMSPKGTHLLIAPDAIPWTVSLLPYHEWHAWLLPVSLEPSTFRLLESASRLQCSQSSSNQWPFGLSLGSALSIIIAHDNWRCSIQPEIFTHQNFAGVGIRSRFDSGRVLCAYR